MRLSKPKSSWRPSLPPHSGGSSLSPLFEGPVPECEQEAAEEEDRDGESGKFGDASAASGSWVTIKSWLKKSSGSQTDATMMTMTMMTRKTKTKKRKKKMKKILNSRVLLLGVLGCPLSPLPTVSSSSQSPALPLPPLSIKNMSIEASSAQYIVHQYIAATGGAKLRSSFYNNSYMSGKVRMVMSGCGMGDRLADISAKASEDGWFVLWNMRPDNWYLELALGGTTIKAGSNGKVVWRYTPWLGSHLAKGPIRPLRRALQGLDPIEIASIFSKAQRVGEKRIGDEDCFLLKVAADQSTLSERSEGATEIIKHVLVGCFSHRTGYLVYLEDSNLTRIQPIGSEVVYWETMIASTLKDYREVDGVALAHGGHSIVTLYRFGEEAMNHSRTRMEETWSIEEVAFNVSGLSDEFFIPPTDIAPMINSKDASSLVDGIKSMSIGKDVS